MQPRLPMCGIHLPKSARYKARFMVRGSKGMQGGGHSIAIRQLYQGEEVGRVTWQFHRRTKEEEQCK